MSITHFSADTVDDPREFASRRVIGVLGVQIAAKTGIPKTSVHRYVDDAAATETTER